MSRNTCKKNTGGFRIAPTLHQCKRHARIESEAPVGLESRCLKHFVRTFVDCNSCQPDSCFILHVCFLTNSQTSNVPTEIRKRAKASGVQPKALCQPFVNDDDSVNIYFGHRQSNIKCCDTRDQTSLSYFNTHQCVRNVSPPSEF